MAERKDYRKPWTPEQKKKLMEVFARDGAINLKNSREIGGGHNSVDCQIMCRMLEEYEILGKPRIEIRDGVKVTIFPPARARGVRGHQKY